jgi:hypothetical protein
VIDNCQRAKGIVRKVVKEEDGDLQIALDLSERYRDLINDANRERQHGYLVVEFMARDGDHLPRPHKDDRLDLTGALVEDVQHANWR